MTEIPQTAEATSSGITLRAAGAVYSGTETLVRLGAEVANAGALPANVDAGAVKAIVPARDGFSGPFAGNRLQAGPHEDGTVLLQLPPLAAPPDYAGTVEFKVTAVTVRASSGDVRVTGEWGLLLQGPTPADLPGVLRVEALERVSINLGGEQILASGQRSTSQTRVNLEVPQGITVLGQPQLRVNGTTVAPYSVEPTAAGMTVLFLPTSFDTPISIDLGAVAVAGDRGTARFTVNVGQAMARAEGPAAHGKFAIGSNDVLSGDAGAVVSGQRGAWVQLGVPREWVKVTVKGSWPPNEEPQVFDERGTALVLSGYDVGFTKDLQGNIGPGETSITVFVDDPAKVGVLTFLPGVEVKVERGPHLLTLKPGK